MSIQLAAQPYCTTIQHSLSLNVNGECIFVNTDDNYETGIWYGTWTMNDQILTLVYTREENVETPLNLPISIVCTVHVKDEYTLFHNDQNYCLSNAIWTFERSPCPYIEKWNANFLNVPLIFYANLNQIYEIDIPRRILHGKLWPIDSPNNIIESLHSYIRKYPPDIDADLINELKRYGAILDNHHLDTSGVSVETYLLCWELDDLYEKAGKALQDYPKIMEEYTTYLKRISN